MGGEYEGRGNWASPRQDCGQVDPARNHRCVSKGGADHEESVIGLRLILLSRFRELVFTVVGRRYRLRRGYPHRSR